MNDFIDDPEGVEQYDYALRMRELRKRKKQIGVMPHTVEVPKLHRKWWSAQSSLATAEYMLRMIDKGDPDFMEICADLRIRTVGKLAEAVTLKDNAPVNATSLAHEHFEAVQDQVRYRRLGQEAMQERDYDTGRKNFALEYATSLKVRGLHNLIRYIMEGGDIPRVRDAL